jgi:cell division septum initiation protein DivIVA
MTTNIELKALVNKLKEDLVRLQTSNSDLRDEVHMLKNNYSTLVEEMSTRLEVIHKKFRSQ